MTSMSLFYLFGGDRVWSPLDWTSSDDRVRGGSSISKLDCTPTEPIAIFHGNLDIETLGGAGFASQRTTDMSSDWDLSPYDGIELDISKADGKQYTFILKDEILPKSPNGREQSTISWEFDFKPEETGEKVVLRWADLKPTYRGRESKDAAPIDLKHIKRISLMMRSFFGTQQGDFSLAISSIGAFKGSGVGTFSMPYRDDPAQSVQRSETANEKSVSPDVPQTWLGWLRDICLG